MRAFRNLIPASLRGTRAPVAALLLLAFLAPGLSAPAEAKKDKITRAERKEMRAAAEKLPEKYRGWLEEVDPLITDEELKSFLALEKDYQRDAFIKRFWEVRDPYKGTARNEFQDRYEAYVEEARSRFGGLTDERARILLLNGAPAAAITSSCSTLLWPIEIWFYKGSDRLGQEFFVVFYRKWGAGPYRIWNPLEGIDVLFADAGAAGTALRQQRSLGEIASGCRDGDKLAAGIGWVANQRMGYTMIQSRIEAKPDGPGGEWVTSFGSMSTEVPEGAALLNAKLDVEFPGRHQNRTVVHGFLSVPVSEAGLGKVGEHRSYNFLINGEILGNGELFDNFRYRFDFPADVAADPADPNGAALPLLFQRYLRPGDYTLILRLEDINSGKLFRAERALTVPSLEGTAALVPPPQTPEEKESLRLLEEAHRAIANGETTVKILRPPGDLQAGMLRFDTLTTGDIASVTFALDGKPVLTKKKPPYSVELDLGSLPRPRRLTVTAFNVGGQQIASDELLVNSSGHRFRVRLAEPQRGQRYESSLLARVEAEVPDGEALERIEIFLNETRLATLYQPPWQQPIILPKEVAYVRAVGYLTDGNSTEDLVFVNSPDYIDEVDVDFVELYTTVFDRGGHPVEGMEQKDFTVTEDGARQEIARFERVTDLPIHATLALDISASMEDSVDQARQAALQFLQETVRPKDRASVVLFNDRPTLTTKFTNDHTILAGGLAGIKAERGTALYDTIVFTLYYNNGIRGQRAVLLLSDGKDEGSRFSYEDALEYARRAGVTIYAIGLGDDVDKKKMEKIAEETGGRFFQAGDAAQLSGIYATIEKELRSQYLIAYQSTNTSGSTDFRTVELKVGKSGLEAKTMRGYYP